MADKKFTFLELHLGDGDVQFGPKSIDTGETRGVESTEEIEEETGTEASGGRSLLPVVLGLLVLVGVAFAAKKFVGGGETEELEELDEIATEA
jgi:hypothetical protein